jgi:hypothetical protein
VCGAQANKRNIVFKMIGAAMVTMIFRVPGDASSLVCAPALQAKPKTWLRVKGRAALTSVAEPSLTGLRQRSVRVDDFRPDHGAGRACARHAATGRLPCPLPLTIYENRQCGFAACKPLMKDGGVTDRTLRALLPTLHAATGAGLRDITHGATHWGWQGREP